MPETIVPLRISIKSDGQFMTAIMFTTLLPVEQMATEEDIDKEDGFKMVLGTISVPLCNAHPELFDKWKGMLTEVLANHVKEFTGIMPDMREIKPLDTSE